MSAQDQSAADKAVIKIKLIENGILVGCGIDGWFSFETWERASEHIGMRIKRLESDRKMTQTRSDGLNLIDRIKRHRGNLNSGHGHVWERPDGMKARCGGAGLCKECSADLNVVREPAL